MSLLVGGTASAQFLLVLVAPLLTRLYSPEDFGLLAVYSSLLALIGVISSLRYELAIPLPEDDVEAANVAVLCLALVLLNTLLTSIFVLFMREYIAMVLDVPKLADYLWLLPLGVLLTGIYSVFNYLAVRSKNFGNIARTKLSQALATIVIQLTAFKMGGIALLFGQVAGQGMGTITLGLQALKSSGFKQVSWTGIKIAAIRYRRFPAYSTPDAFANSAGIQLPPIMIASLFGPAAAGLFSLAHRILNLPITLLGRAIGQVFFSNGAEAFRAGTLGILVSDLQVNLIKFGMIPAILIFIFGPICFPLIFGDGWRLIGDISQWMIPWLYFQFISSPLSTVFIIKEKQSELLIFQIVMLASRIVSLVVGSIMDDLLLTIALFSFANVLCYLGLMFWVNKIVHNSIGVLLGAFTKEAIYSAAIMAPFLIFSYGHESFDFYSFIGFLITIVLIFFRYKFLWENKSSY